MDAALPRYRLMENDIRGSSAATRRISWLIWNQGKDAVTVVPLWATIITGAVTLSAARRAMASFWVAYARMSLWKWRTSKYIFAADLTAGAWGREATHGSLCYIIWGLRPVMIYTGIKGYLTARSAPVCLLPVTFSMGVMVFISQRPSKMGLRSCPILHSCQGCRGLSIFIIRIVWFCRGIKNKAIECYNFIYVSFLHSVFRSVV